MRFPGFTDEWKTYSLSNFFDFKNGLNPEANRFGQGIKFISVSDILNNDYIDYDKIISSVTPIKKELDEYGVNRGDILFQRSSETLEDVGRANVYIDDRIALFGGFVIRGKKKSEYEPYFMRYALSAPINRKKIIVKGAGAQHFNIGQDGLSKVLMNIPDIDEQTKIGHLLRLIDERIATQNKIINNLKKLKSSIIDRLYSEVKGEIYMYSDLFTVVTERNNKRLYNKVIAASQEFGMVERESLNLKVQFDEELINTYKIINSGDYVIHLRSFQGGFAFSRLQGICSPAYIILRPNDLIEYSYFENYFTSSKFINSLRLVTYGIRDGRSINVDEWLSMKVNLPSKDEQKRIIQTIQSIQYKVSNEKEILRSLHRQRLFLLQELFI